MPFKSDGGLRDYYWSLLKKRYKEVFSDVEVCVGLDDSKMFNRARAINRAARRATTNIFIIADADVYFERSLVEKAIESLDYCAWIVPFKRAYRLNQEATQRVISLNFPENINFSKSEIQHFESFPGTLITIMTREAFYRVAGFDERFEGWGGEDIAMSCALNTLHGVFHRLDSFVVHLWHEMNSCKISNMLAKRYEFALFNKVTMQNLIDERRTKISFALGELQITRNFSP